MHTKNPASMTQAERDAARKIPQGATRLAVKDCDAVVYWKAGVRADGRPYVWLVAFQGKAVKPAANYTFARADQASKWIATWREGLLSRAAMMAEHKAKRESANVLQVGDVLRSSWGYDQTNVDYYQVTRTSGRSVWVRTIGELRSHSSDMAGQCFPDAGNFTGPEKRYLVQNGNSIRIASYASAYPVKYSEPVPGARVYESTYWSSYA